MYTLHLLFFLFNDFQIWNRICYWNSPLESYQPIRSSPKPKNIFRAKFCTEPLERHLLLLFSSRVMSFNSLEPKQPIRGRDMRYGPIRGPVTFSPDGAWHFWYQRLSCLGQDSASPGSQCPSSTWLQDSGWPFRVVMSLLSGCGGRGPDQ